MLTVFIPVVKHLLLKLCTSQICGQILKLH